MPRRGPPYNDDPGCQFVVIEDPWPGNATGKDRKEFFLNYLSAWVRFMLGKEHDVECIYTVNTVCPMYNPARYKLASSRSFKSPSLTNATRSLLGFHVYSATK